MIEIRLVKDYDKSQLKFILDKIKEVAPRELTYGMEAGIDTVDVNIKDATTPVTHRRYKRYSEEYFNYLWIVIFQGSYTTYYQGESYSGESLDEIIYDMFK